MNAFAQLGAMSYNNLAANLDAQGKACDAEPLYRQALVVREEVLVPKHPDAATSYTLRPPVLLAGVHPPG